MAKRKNRPRLKNPDTDLPQANTGCVRWEELFFNTDKEVELFLQLMELNHIIANCLERYSREEINDACNKTLGVIGCLTQGDIKKKFGEGNTVLHILVYRGVYAVVDLILSNGWNLSIINTTNDQGKTIFAIDKTRVSRLDLSCLSLWPKKFLQRNHLTIYHPIGKVYRTNSHCLTLDFSHKINIYSNGHGKVEAISLSDLSKHISNSENGLLPTILVRNLIRMVFDLIS